MVFGGVQHLWGYRKSNHNATNWLFKHVVYLSVWGRPIRLLCLRVAHMFEQITLILLALLPMTMVRSRVGHGQIGLNRG